jgi:hypothetical protein
MTREARMTPAGQMTVFVLCVLCVNLCVPLWLMDFIFSS